MEKYLIVFSVLLFFSLGVDSSQSVMKEITVNFNSALNTCIEELNLPDSVTEDFDNFWKEGYEFTNRFTGCAIRCLSSKLELVDSDGNLHLGNTHAFTSKHGADANMAQHLVTLIQDCKSSAAPNDDICLRALDVVKCFKHEVHKLDWAPNIEVVADL